jgi:hypothetical protein
MRFIKIVVQLPVPLTDGRLNYCASGNSHLLIAYICVFVILGGVCVTYDQDYCQKQYVGTALYST